MNGLEFDTSQSGFKAVLKDWQLKAMKVVWASQEGANSRTVWNKVNQALQGETISRARKSISMSMAEARRTIPRVTPRRRV